LGERFAQIIDSPDDFVPFAREGKQLSDRIFRRGISLKEQIKSVAQATGLGGVDFGKIFQIYDLAAEFYEKKFPKFDEIRVIHEGEEKLFKNLSPLQQVEMLEKGARGHDERGVAKLMEMLNSEDFFPSEQFTEMVSALLGVEEGEVSKHHDGGHMGRAALVVVSIVKHFGKLFEEFRNVSDEEIEDAMIAALFHDSGRQGDGIDIFDEVSAKNANDTLTQSGLLPRERIERIANAIVNKDASLEGKDIVAILLHEADFLEYGRFNELDAQFSDSYNPSYTEEAPLFNFRLMDGVTPKQAQLEMTLLLWKAFDFSSFNGTRREKIYFPKASPLYWLFTDRKNGRMFDTKYTYFKQERRDVSTLFRGKMQSVSADTICGFLSEDSHCSSLFSHENVFEISEKILQEDFSGAERIIPENAIIKMMKEAAAFCQTLKREGWSEKMAQHVAYYRLKFEEFGIFEANEGSEGGEEGVIVDKVNALIKRSTPEKLALYISEMGGSWTFLECLLASQVASSWSPLSVAIKQWLVDQRAVPGDFPVLFPDDRDESTRKSILKVRKNEMSIFATFKKSRDFGGEGGRKAMLANFSKQPESFWIDAMARVARVRFGLPYGVPKEQARVDRLCDLIGEMEANVNGGNLADAQKCWQEVQKLLGCMQKVEQRLRKNIEEIEAQENNADDDLDMDISDLRMIVELFNGMDEKITSMDNFLKEKNWENISEIKKRIADLKFASATFRERIYFRIVSAHKMGDARFRALDTLDVQAMTASEKIDSTAEDGQFSPFDETLYMLYAFTQSLLSHFGLPIPEGYDTPCIRLTRRCDDAYIGNSFQCDGKRRGADGTFQIPDNTEGTIAHTAAYESFSLRPMPPEWATSFGNHTLEAVVPVHRILFPAFIESAISSIVSSPDDVQGEVATISCGCKARYISSPSEKLPMYPVKIM
jgi:hypothetical protein